MDKNRSPAVIAAAGRLGVRPVITALEAGLFIYMLAEALRSGAADGYSGPWFASRLLLAAFVLFLFLGSLCRTVSAVRDLAAARNGETRGRSRAEKVLPIVFYSLAGVCLAAALAAGACSQKPQSGACRGAAPALPLLISLTGGIIS